jgi:hypothetical protein
MYSKLICAALKVSVVVLAVVVYMNFYLLGGRVVFEEPTRMSAWTRKRQKVTEWDSLSS